MNMCFQVGLPAKISRFNRWIEHIIWQWIADCWSDDSLQKCCCCYPTCDASCLSSLTTFSAESVLVCCLIIKKVQTKSSRKYVHFYPRDAMLTRVIVIATCLSACLSVRPSVTRRYCVKTKKASGMVSSPSGSPKTLIFRRQISSPNSKGFPRTGASNKGRSEKFSDFSALSVNISKTVADTAKVTISD